MTTTVGYTTHAGENGAPLAWVLVLAHHPDSSLLGRRLRFETQTTLELHRGATLLGEGSFDDNRLSREHARFEVAADGTLRVEDLQSKNGTFVDGRRVSKRQLVPGNVIAAGSMLWVARREPPDVQPEIEADWVAVSAALVDMSRALRSHATTPGHLLLLGDAGTGKEAAAQRLHELAKCEGPFVVLDCASVSALGRHADVPGLLAAARGGVLYLDSLADADAALQQALLRFLQTGDIPANADSTGEPIKTIAASTRPLNELTSEGCLRGDFAAALGSATLQIPTLKSRVEDVPALARRFARRYSGEERALHRNLVAPLMAHDWPGNCRELENLVERTVLENQETQGPLRETESVRGLLIEDSLPAPELVRTQDSYRVGADGSWFEPPRGERVELDTRPTLRNILRALIEHPADSATGLSIEDLFRVGWPSERASTRSQSSRVYVALTTLRKLGLRDLLLRDKRGYRVSPDVGLRVLRD